MESADMRSNRVFDFHLLVVLFALWMAALLTVCAAEEQMDYFLLDGSLLVDDCMCGRPPIPFPIRGSFRLVFREENPLFKFYDIKDLRFHTLTETPNYEVTGHGTYEIGGEVALVQKMELYVQFNDQTEVLFFSGEGPIERVCPMIGVKARQQPPELIQFFWLDIIAAPVREIWFSTAASFTSGTGAPSGTGGDLLSHQGLVVKTNPDLVSRLGIMPAVPNLGLDAVDIVPGGEVFLSCEDSTFSETLGPLQHGDLLSDRGRIVRTNQQLTSAFVPEPLAPDVGLDAVHVQENGEILFSIEDELFSEALGVTLRRGDLLSDKGVILRTNKELLASFEPVDSESDVGLDAVHVWPNGEIWFSTELGFQSKTLGFILPGDLVSTGDVLTTKGFIVFRNLDLLQPFGPLEDLVDFGLDALFLVTESRIIKPPTPRATISRDGSPGHIWIGWAAEDGKVFQVERADDPSGPYAPIGPISPEVTYLDPAASLLKSKSYYRIRLW
jgi:hypothetical protein